MQVCHVVFKALNKPCDITFIPCACKNSGYVEQCLSFAFLFLTINYNCRYYGNNNLLQPAFMACYLGPVYMKKTYRKIPKISPGTYIFQRPFLRGLVLEGLLFRGAYLRREICVSKWIGLALQLEVNLSFWLCFTLYLRAIFQVQALGGLIFGEAI